MDGYLDFGSDPDNEDSPNECNNQIMEVDSDEEERNQNDEILKMLMEKSDNSYAKSKKNQAIEDFEAEMEAELDRRASEVENEGGMKHQMSLSRSSSSSSLNKVATSEASEERTGESAGPSASKRPKTMLKDPKYKNNPSSPKKSVKFSEETTSIASADDTNKISQPSLEKTATEKNPTKRYEDIYFDSDESDGEDDANRKSRHDKREFLTNDDLFYDPKSDSKDQDWVDKRRRKYYLENKTSSASSTQAGSSSSKLKAGLEEELGGTSKSKSVKLPRGVKPLPTSDAVLNCPACFTVLCLDCQRHEFYNNQYRAMFVMNCVVNAEDVIYAPLKQKKSQSRGSKVQAFSTEPTDSDDVKDKFNTVKCKVCSTQIGVYDHDEVYHFINVLASHS